MNKVAGYIGLALTVLGLLVSGAMQWQRLQDRVQLLEDRDRYEHGSYALPLQERSR